MLPRLVQLSVAHRGLVLSAWALLCILAALLGPKLSVDAVPDVTNTQVNVITSAPGLSPVEVEQYLTVPIEAAMNGVPNVANIRSVSRTAVSSVNIIFNDGVDLWFARQLVGERLKVAEAEIPDGMGRPELGPVSTGLGEIYEFYLTSSRHSAMELRTLMDWVVAYRLRQLPGVAEVNAMGGDAKQYQVSVDARRLAAYRLTLRQVQDALQNNNGAIGGGYIEKNSESYVIRADAQFKSIDDIGRTVLTVDNNGTPVLLRNVAKIQAGAALKFGMVTALGAGDIVAGTVMMLSGANARNVVAAVRTRMQEIEKDLPEGVSVHTYYNRAEFIDRMLTTVGINLAEGASLVVVLLFLALGSLPGALLAALAIPLAMAVALLGMLHLNITGNLMSLGAIDFGLLVDGPIVLLEAALAALAGLAATDVPRRRAAMSEAMQQGARAVTFSLLIILLVYLPLMALEGQEGRMFRPMAITVALALFGALSFSLTAFPALCACILPYLKGIGHGSETGPMARLQRAYARRLEQALGAPRRVLGGATALVLLALALSTGLGAEFLPRLDEGELSLDVRRLPSIAIGEARRLGLQVETVLSRFPEVLSVVSRTGRGEVATEPVGPDEVAVRVKLRPRHDWTTAADLDGLGDAIKTAIEAEVPATFVAISQPIEDRVNQLLAGSRADVVVKVLGDDLTQLKGIADAVGRRLAPIDGVADLRVQRVLGLPLLEIRPERQRLARYGIPARDVLEIVEASRVGRYAGRIFEGMRRFDLMLLLPPQSLRPEAFGNLLVGSPSGQLLPLASVATLKESEGPAVINRRDPGPPGAGGGQRARPRHGVLRAPGAAGHGRSAPAQGRAPGLGRPVRELPAGQRPAGPGRSHRPGGGVCHAVPHVRQRARRPHRVRQRPLGPHRRHRRPLAAGPALLHPRRRRLHCRLRGRRAQRGAHDQRHPPPERRPCRRPGGAPPHAHHGPGGRHRLRAHGPVHPRRRRGAASPGHRGHWRHPQLHRPGSVGHPGAPAAVQPPAGAPGRRPRAGGRGLETEAAVAGPVAAAPSGAPSGWVHAPTAPARLQVRAASTGLQRPLTRLRRMPQGVPSGPGTRHELGGARDQAGTKPMPAGAPEGAAGPGPDGTPLHRECRRPRSAIYCARVTSTSRPSRVCRTRSCQGRQQTAQSCTMSPARSSSKRMLCCSPQ